MKTAKEKSCMNAYGTVDYKAPVADGQDMRTSTYRALIHQTDIALDSKTHIKQKEKCGYIQDPKLSKYCISDYKENFDWKYPNPGELRFPRECGIMQYMKPFSETKLRFLMRPMKPMRSTTHEHYSGSVEQVIETPPKQLDWDFEKPVKAKPQLIDRTSHSYTKYLDPNATTMNLAYVHYEPHQIMASVANHDNITFWNWNDKHVRDLKVVSDRDETMCEGRTAQQCPKRRGEFINLLKHVPHNGLISETSASYKQPIESSVDFRSQLQPYTTFMDVVPSQKKTENMIYGSGEKTHKYVKCKNNMPGKDY